MLAAALLSAVAVVFPRDGQQLPAISQCYAIGSTDGGESSLTIQGRQVPVSAGGGWVTMLEVQPGTNEVDFAGSRVTFVVAQPTAAGAEKERTYTKLPYAADEPLPSPRGKPAEDVIIVLDAGHGGADTGTLSPHGRPEKEVNLMVTLAVADILRREGFRVELTRERDVAVPLYDRPRAAHALKAAAFVSIHHNAPPYDRDPRQFRYHAVYSWNPLGEELATAVNRRMAEAFGETLRNNGCCHANFAVTRSPEIPSCLVEVDFITTPEGERDCWRSDRRARVARAIADGISDWAGAVLPTAGSQTLKRPVSGQDKEVHHE